MSQAFCTVGYKEGTQEVRAGERVRRLVCWGCEAVDGPFANRYEVTREPATSATACH